MPVPRDTAAAARARFSRAHDEGLLSAAAHDVLCAPEVGDGLDDALGVPIDDVPHSEVVLLTQMPDDSGSIAAAGQADVVCAGHNAVLDAVAAAAERDNVFAHTRYLNGRVLFPYRPLAEAVRMGPHNYRADRGTPLHDQAVALLRAVLAEALRFEEAGVAARTITVLLTDGADRHSRRHSAADVAALVAALRRSEQHLVLALGIGPDRAALRATFAALGLGPAEILTPGDDPAAIRAAFQLVSRAAAAASRSAGGFAPALLGGFAG